MSTNTWPEPSRKTMVSSLCPKLASYLKPSVEEILPVRTLHLLLHLIIQPPPRPIYLLEYKNQWFRDNLIYLSKLVAATRVLSLDARKNLPCCAIAFLLWSNTSHGMMYPNNVHLPRFKRHPMPISYSCKVRQA